MRQNPAFDSYLSWFILRWHSNRHLSLISSSHTFGSYLAHNYSNWCQQPWEQFYYFIMTLNCRDTNIITSPKVGHRYVNETFFTIILRHWYHFEIFWNTAIFFNQYLVIENLVLGMLTHLEIDTSSEVSNIILIISFVLNPLHMVKNSNSKIHKLLFSVNSKILSWRFLYSPFNHDYFGWIVLKIFADIFGAW